MAKATKDRRTERTRSALVRAFVELVLTDGYAALTVDDIAARANVGRSTFYLHYNGKLDLLKQSIRHPSSQLAEILDGGMTPQMLVPGLLHFYGQRKINRPFFVAPIRDHWVRVLAALIEPRLAARARGSSPRLPLPLMALQIAEAQLALVIHWLAGRSSIAPEAIAAALIETTDAMVAALLPDGRALNQPKP